MADRWDWEAVLMERVGKVRSQGRFEILDSRGYPRGMNCPSVWDVQQMFLWELKLGNVVRVWDHKLMREREITFTTSVVED